VGFATVALLITGLIHLYLWRRLVGDTVTNRRLRRLTAAAAAGLAVLIPATLAAAALPVRYERWVAWPGFVWLGVMFYLLVALLVLEVPVLVAGLVLRLRARARPSVRTAAGAAAAGAPVADRALAPEKARATEAAPAAARRVPAGGGAPPPAPPAAGEDDADPGRRLLLRRGAAIAAGLIATGAAGWGVHRAYRPPTVHRLDVPLPRLDPRADGLRVAVVADLHVGPLYGGRQVARVVEIVNSLDADLVTVVGDMVTSEAGEVRDALAPLRHLRSRYGGYAVTGNHEYYTGHEEWVDVAEELGLRVLRNERVEIVHGGAAVDLAGVNDVEGGRHGDPPDFAAALGDRDPSRPAVLLAHQPVQVRQAAAYGVDLQLSGHTHGGQVFPFHLLVRSEQPVLAGLAEVDGTRVYVTRGTGFWGPPMRVGADPEVSLLVLRSA